MFRSERAPEPPREWRRGENPFADYFRDLAEQAEAERDGTPANPAQLQIGDTEPAWPAGAA